MNAEQHEKNVPLLVTIIVLILVPAVIASL